MTYCKHCGADLSPNKQSSDVKEILHKEYTIDYLNEILEDIESSLCNEDYSEDCVFEVSVKYRKQ